MTNIQQQMIDNMLFKVIAVAADEHDFADKAINYLKECNITIAEIDEFLKENGYDCLENYYLSEQVNYFKLSN